MRIATKFVRGARRLWQLALFAGFTALLVAITVYFSEDNPTEIVGVARVVDGDSLKINGQNIRLKGLDAPELAQYCERNNERWACGQEAQQQLSEFLGGGFVNCAAVGKDKYRRILATCEAHGRDIGQWLVVNGWAISYGDYVLDETLARRNKVGVWQGEFERPQDWRRRSGISEAPFGVLEWIKSLFN
jgi:endonuclease YncB( thermonuclease family)